MDILISYMVFNCTRFSVIFDRASYLKGMCSFLYLCCQGPHFTGIQKDGFVKECIDHFHPCSRDMLSNQIGVCFVTAAVAYEDVI